MKLTETSELLRLEHPGDPDAGAEQLHARLRTRSRAYELPGWLAEEADGTLRMSTLADRTNGSLSHCPPTTHWPPVPRSGSRTWPTNPS